MGGVPVTLFDDTSDTRTDAVATTALAELFSYAHQWALQENRKDSCTLSFSSMLAAMTAGTDPLCGWLRSHLALRGVRGGSMTKGRSFSAQPLPGVLKTTLSFRRAFAKARQLCPNEEKDGLAVRHFMAAYAVVPGYHQGPEGENDAPAPGPTIIDPDIISGDELKYLDQLAGLLDGNPRSLKRFVNTYRLVKTALSDVELAVFLQPLRMIAAHAPDERAAKYSPYRICMAQLAVLCTQRKRALCLVRHADQATENTSLTEWLTQFNKIDADLASCFRTALSEDLGADVNTFKLWLERTRRYSFYL